MYFEINQCIRDLSSDDSNIRRIAAEALSKVQAPEAVDALGVAVTDTIRRVRFPAVQALILTGDERAVPHLAKALNDRDEKTAKTAADGLVKFGSVSVEYIIPLLQHELWKIRLLTVETLGKIGDKKTIPHLVEMLVDEKSDVCRAAAFSLKKMGDPVGELVFQGILGDRKAIERIILDGDPRCFPMLLKALKDREWKARKFSAFLLGKIMVKEAVEPLIETLRDQDSWVRQSAAEALGKLKDEKAVKDLMRCLADPELEVRGESALSLGKLKAMEAVPRLIKLLRDAPSVRENAAQALGEIGDPSSAEALIETLEDFSDTVRIKAAEALGKIKCTKAVDPLFKAGQKNRIEPELAEASLKEIIKSNKTAWKKTDRILCSHCLSRFTKYSRKLTLFQNYSYSACRVCRGQEFIDGAKEVTALLNKKTDPRFINEKNRLLVNWFAVSTPFDFESVLILDADPFEVEGFVMKIRNDPDQYRLKNLKKVRVTVSESCNLPALKINLLKETFGKVEVKALKTWV